MRHQKYPERSRLHIPERGIFPFPCLTTLSGLGILKPEAQSHPYTILNIETPPRARRFGPILCYRYGTLVMVPICLIAPAMSLLVRETFARYLGLMAILVVRNIASTTAFTGVLLIVSNSSPPEDAGKVRIPRGWAYTC